MRYSFIHPRPRSSWKADTHKRVKSLQSPQAHSFLLQSFRSITLPLTHNSPSPSPTRNPVLRSHPTTAMALNPTLKPLTSLLVCLCLFLFVSPALSVVDDKCSACKAVALELEESLANERPRNHLDYRHRLGSTGQREGKVIDYRVSELRVVELLDGLCAKMKGYVPNKTGPGREFWLKVEGGVPDDPEMAFNKQASELHSRAIVEFCGRLIETTEEELTEKIRVGVVATGDVERVLCKELSKSCKETSESPPPAEAEAEDKEDLDDEADDAVAASNVDNKEEEKPEATVNEAVSMGSDGEL